MERNPVVRSCRFVRWSRDQPSAGRYEISDGEKTLLCEFVAVCVGHGTNRALGAPTHIYMFVLSLSVVCSSSHVLYIELAIGLFY